ncbi:MAG TPA: nucleotide exchange factor GrpE [Vicinamibacteria bacterium]|nr:nucleotide exchange factor GrpE [Vicinamibacteria bacterium]
MPRKRHKKKRKPQDLEPLNADFETAQEAEPEQQHSSGTSAAPAEETATGDGLHAEVERLRTTAQEMRELAQRKQAEFENFRRRTERERAEVIRYASSDLVKEILPVLDNLERAIHASDTENESQLRQGIAIIHKQFKDILERNGLEEIDCEQKPFDPHVHEAVSRVETDDYPDGTVVEVFQKGYRMKDRLLRPSMVSVAHSSGTESAPSDGDVESEDEVVRQSD